MRYYCGIDIGASSAKLVVINQDRELIAKALQASGVDYARSAEECLAAALASAHLQRDQIDRTVSTGYGRDNVAWSDGKMTELACHGKGAYHHVREKMTVIDIGAQDNKIVRLDQNGRRISFTMNRKCAAGTGAFLEEIAHRLDIPMARLNELAEQSTEEVTLGSFCTVFAATEILGKIRVGCQVEDIVKGAFRSVANRLVEMDTVEGTLVMTGGVIAHNRILASMVQEVFGRETIVPPEPQHMGAFGAALFALEQAEKG